MKRITDFIVEKRYIVFTLVLILTLGCTFLIDDIKINRDISKYLPKDSEVRIGKDIMDEEFKEVETSTLNVMFKDLKKTEKESIYEQLKNYPDVEVDYDNSKDYNRGKYTLYIITGKFSADSKEATKLYNKVLDKYEDYDISTSGDINEENKEVLPFYIVAIAVGCALIILIIMCDSFVEPFLFLLSIGIAVLLNKGTNIMFGSISSITDSICAILQMALSMDYSIMLMSRYRQEKKEEKDNVKAMKKALFKAFSSISSSSVTTVVGLIALVFMSFTIGRDLGFVLAKGVLFSLFTIFTCLPALILMCDKLITKTKKKSPVFNLKYLGKYSYHIRYISIFLFAFVFIVSFLLKGNLTILYTDKEVDEISKVFDTDNQMAIIYNNKYEQQIAKYCRSLDKNKAVNNVLCYGNTINEKLTYQDLNKRLQEFKDDFSIDDYLLKIIYYNYYNKDKEKMTFNELVNFIKNNVYQNEEMSKHISNPMRQNINKLENFTNENLINQKRTSQEIANMFEISQEDVDDLLVYYNSLHGNNTLTIEEFVNFMNNYILKSKYSQSVDKSSVSKLNRISKFVNKNEITKEISSMEMANLFTMDKSSVDQLYLYYTSLSDINVKLTIEQFSTFVLDNFSTSIDNNMKEELTLLKQFSNKDLINQPLDSNTMATILGVDPGKTSALYMLMNLMNKTQESKFTPYDLVTFIVNNSNLDLIKNNIEPESLTKLQLVKMVMDSSLNDITYSYQEMTNNLKLTDINMVKNIYSVYVSSNTNIMMSPYNFVNFILNHQNDPKLKGSINSNTLKDLTLLKTIMDSTLNNTRYTSSNLSQMFGIDNESMKLLYSLYEVKYQTKNLSLSYKEFVDFLLNNIVTNNKYNKNLTSQKITKLKTVNGIINSTFNKTKYTKDEMYAIVYTLASDVDKNLIDLLYIYYGSNNNYQANWKLTIEEFVNYLNNDILTDSRFDDFIDESRRCEIIESKDTIKDAKKQLVGNKYSRVVINTNLDLESKKTFNFINKLESNLKHKDIYLIGDSPMAYNLDKTFGSELDFITVLTMIFIFIVVMVTFKSILIPIILVLLIQTAVYLTMGILYFSGGEVYFIALLIVQSILMGATIDYAILYTSYYLESRKSMNIKESIINSYNKSIHTIFTSASILIIVTLIVGCMSTAITSKICKTISEGTICSTILILFLLPAVLSSVDKFIIKEKITK